MAGLQAEVTNVRCVEAQGCEITGPILPALLAALDRLLPHLQGTTRRITVCQQIFFLQHRWIFERAGITDVFWPHTTIFAADPTLRLHRFPLFAVQ
ncbi:hypothetical protein [Cyanobium sp. LEGE 06143]|uniref:hypothetical protein n=1 Tax=Cyanobium sp. LEGE 06143 TaxID=945727 RepID=UPI001880AEE6|nr:hypothetical protein [Cyanobium sp. LEGE 06143]